MPWINDKWVPESEFIDHPDDDFEHEPNKEILEAIEYGKTHPITKRDREHYYHDWF